MTTPGILGAVLAGGESRRMGVDKALLEVGGRTLVERAVAVLEPLCDEVIVAAGRRRLSGLEARVVTDRTPGRGPLGGLETALAEAAGRPVLVLACDLPNVVAELVGWVIERAGGGAASGSPRAWVPSAGGRAQPLAALYSPGVLAASRSRLAGDDWSMAGLLASIDTSVLPLGPELPFYRPDLLANVNRPGDLERVAEAATPASPSAAEG